MRVTVEVVGEDTHEFDVENATYADLLTRIDVSPHEVSVMVDGTPVPEDQPVDTDHVRVLRLIKGGSVPASDGDTGDDTSRPVADPPNGVVVRRASPRDYLGVQRVVDGANLELSGETTERRIDGGTVVVADHDDRVVGALVAVRRDEGAHVEAVAVQRRRRDQGIGAALVARAADEWPRLTAEFDPSVQPFYESLGFDCRKQGERYRGVLRVGDE